MADNSDKILNYYGLKTDIAETKRWTKKYVEEQLADFTTDLTINVTYNELVSLRNNNQLKPGMQYRITDYVTIVYDETGTITSAEHPFDLILVADSTNTLNENAEAKLHVGDEYFKDCDLSSWKIKYCLDNDASRFKFAKEGQEGNPGLGFAAVQLTPFEGAIQVFKRYPNEDSIGQYWCAWALVNNSYYKTIEEITDWESLEIFVIKYTASDTPSIGDVDGSCDYKVTEFSANVGYVPTIASGKGYIYYLKDEFGNEAPYDFKNIQQRDGECTFGKDGEDYSLKGYTNGVYDNKVLLSMDSESNQQIINQVRFTEKNCYGNLIKPSCQDSYINFQVSETDLSINDDGGLVLAKAQEFITGIENKEIPVNPLSQYLTFEAIDDNCKILFHCIDYDDIHNKTIEVSSDMQTWNSFTSSRNCTILATLNSGEKLYVRGNNSGYCDTEKYYDEDTGQWETICYYNRFIPTEKCYVYGNIMSLINPNNFKDLKEFSTDYTFYSLFYENIYYDGRSIKNTLFMSEDNKVLLPATTLTEFCYAHMFYTCSALDCVPELPATTLANSCYQEMFRQCTSLTIAPELPATTLANFCYAYMFFECTSLTTAPVLPSTTLTEGCYEYMFFECTSLITPPDLPATTLANSCYANMFQNCTSLSTVPQNFLPATILTEYCYSAMFDGCTGLTNAPELPATTLAPWCYSWMFRGCNNSNFVTAPELPAVTLSEYCYNQMFRNCSNLNYIKCLATNIPVNNCTSNWVSYVQTNSGTFVKNPSMSSWTTGNDGIPNNWTVENDYSYALDNYTLNGNNWVNTELFPYNTGRNFEIEVDIECTFSSGTKNQNIVIISSGSNTAPNFIGARFLYDAGNRRYYCSSAYGEDFGYITSTGRHKYRYVYENGVNYFYLDGSLLRTINRTISNTFSLKVGIGNYEDESIHYQEDRHWKGTIYHMHIKYL